MKMLSLFSGIGGFDLAAQKTGKIETVAFCELDKHCQKVLKKNFPTVPIFNDINNLSTVHIYHGEDFLQEHGEDGKIQTEIFSSDIDIICGGSPCQDVSIAGEKKGFIDEKGIVTRSGLWFEYARLIKEIRPKYVILENVRNLINMGLGRILSDLHGLGYNAECETIGAFDIGANHQRDRLWVVAYDKTTNAHLSGFWPTVAAEKEKQFRGPETAACIGDWFKTLPAICRMDDGVSIGMDKGFEPEKFRRERIKQLGNAIVPFIAEIIFRRLIEVEKL
jgi:DNA (cytosine-5)-methyltransferase 1